MTTWLVTGASGFLGANLGFALAGHGHRVGISRTRPAAGLFDEWSAVDLADPSGVASLIEAMRPDVILNAAAAASHQGCEQNPDLAFSLNRDAAAAVARAAQRVGTRLVHISTDAVFDGARGDYRETDAPSPFGVYGDSKLQGEVAVLEAMPTALVARTNFFGWSPTGSRSILEFFVDSLRAGEAVRGFTDFVVTSIYAQQLAVLLRELAFVEASGVLHVASSDALSKYAFGLAVAEHFGLDGSLITPTAQSTGPDGLSRTRDLSLNIERLTSLLGPASATQSSGIAAAFADQRLRAVFAQNA